MEREAIWIGGHYELLFSIERKKVVLLNNRMATLKQGSFTISTNVLWMK